MAHIANPRKVFNFSLQFAPDPIDPWLAQKVTLPDTDIDVVEHGDANHSIKTGGRINFGATTIEKLMTTDGADNWFWDWVASIQDAIIGGGLPPQMYKKILTVTELAEDGATPINTWVLTGVWPSKINGLPLDRLASDNTIETIELQADVVEKL